MPPFDPPRVRRPFRVCLALFALGISIALGQLVAGAAEGPAAGTDDVQNDPTVSAVSPYRDGTLPVTDEQREAELDQWEAEHRKSSESERLESADAFADLSRDDAASLAESSFTSYFDALDAPVLAEQGDEVTSYLNDNVALVDPQGGEEPQIAVSSMPLRVEGDDGKMVAADPELTASGDGYEPKEAGVDVRFPENLADGISIGDPKSEVTLLPSKLAEVSKPAIVGKGAGVFYGEVATDTDLVLSPVVGGFRLGAQIRSGASPDQIDFELSLPEGAELRSDPTSGGAAVEIGKEQLLEISPAAAIDADGRSVPSRVKVEGERLVLEVEHGDQTPRYPVLVDPTVIDSNLISDDFFDTDPSSATQSSRGWAYWEGYQDPDGTAHSEQNAFTNAYASSLSGLLIGTPAPSLWLPRRYAVYYESVPNWSGTGSTSAFYNYVKFDSLSINSGSSPYQEPHLDLGLFSWDTGLFTDRLTFYGTQSYPYYWIGPTAGRPSNTRPQRINFDMSTGPNNVGLPSASDAKYAFLGGVTAYLADKEAPTPSAASQSPISDQDHWLKTAPSSATFTYTAADLGLGVKTMKFEAGPTTSNTPITQSVPMQIDWPAPAAQPYSPAVPAPANPGPCEGWHFFTACPQHPASRTFSFDATQLNQGINNLYAHPIDAVNKSEQEGRGEMRIDTGAPDVTVTGGLKDSNAAGYDLHIEATDGDSSSNATARSGVVEAKLTIDDPRPRDANHRKTLFDRTQDNFTGQGQQAQRSSAPLQPENQDYELQESEGIDNGTHDFELTITDAAGNETTTTWSETVQFSRPEIDLSGSLKEAADGSHDVDGPTRLRIEASPSTQSGSSVTDLQAEVSTDGGDTFEQAWDFHKDCNSSPPCSLDQTYFHFPERFGRGEIDLRITARDEAGSRKSKTIAFDQDEPRTGQLRQFSFEDFPINDRSLARVNVANGNLLLSESDVAIAGTGLSLDLSRTYNSLSYDPGASGGDGAPRTGEFGNGWTYTVGSGVLLEEESDGDVWFTGPSGYRVLFKKKNVNGPETTYEDPEGNGSAPRGLDAELTKDVNAPNIFELELRQSEEKYDFNGQGELVRHRDRNGHQITFERTNNGLIDEIVDTQGQSPSGGAGHKLTFTHGAHGGEQRIETITDSANRLWSYDYDSDGNLTAYTNPEGEQTTYGYEGSDDPADDRSGGRLTAIVDPLGNRTEIDYAGQTDAMHGNPGRAVAEIRTDATDNDADGDEDFETSYAYDTGNGTCGQGGEDLSNTSDDPQGQQTIYCNDELTQVDKTKDARGLTIQSGYSDRGNIETYSKGTGSGNQTTLSYDSDNRLSSTTSKTGTGSADISSSIDSYDGGSFRPTTSTDAQGNESTRGYTDGNMTSVTAKDENGTDQNVVNLDRWEPGDPSMYQDGTEYSYREVLKGLVRKSKVEVGPPSNPDDDIAKTKYFYGVDGDIEAVLPPDPQGLIRYDTDVLNRIYRITDARGNRRDITYDKLDRVDKIETFDTQGNLVMTTDPTYDANGNLTSRVETPAGGSAATDTYGYDARNLLDFDGLRSGWSHAYDYDRSGNLASLMESDGSASETTNYDYNQVNLITRIAEPGANINTDSETIRFEYEDDGYYYLTDSIGSDRDGRLRRRSRRQLQLRPLRRDPPERHLRERPEPDPLRCRSEVIQPRVDADPKSSNLESITFPGGVEQTFTRDAADRITEIEAAKAAGPTHAHLKWDYTLDSGGPAEQETALRQEVEDLKSGTTTTYGYDYLNRLTSAEEDSGGTSWDYSYNNASELDELTEDANTTDFDHNLAHEITNEDGGPSWGYDDQGNLIDVPGRLELAYNEANQTHQLTPDGDPSIDATYAGLGQGERLSLGSTDYTQDALGLSAETTGGSTTHFTRTDSGTPVGLRKGGQSYYYLTDSIGSVIAMVDSDGDLAANYSYGPYGEIRQNGTSESVQNPIRFAGLYYDNRTELYKAGERYYDPASTTWTQKDPINQVANPREANPYVYAGADPINNTDPSGLLLGIEVDIDIDFSVTEAVANTFTAVAGVAACGAVTAGATAVGTPAAGAVAAGTCFAGDVVTAAGLGMDIADSDNGLFTDQLLPYQ